MRRIAGLMALALTFLLGAHTTGFAQPAQVPDLPTPDHVPNDVPDHVIGGSLLVTGHAQADLGRLQSDLRQAVTSGLAGPGRVGLVRVIPVAGAVFQVLVPAGTERAHQVVLQQLPGVAAVEPEQRVAIQRLPNDPRYVDQWSHQRSGAEQAWDHHTGGDVRVAIIDSGMLGSHPDLVQNIREDQVSTAASGPAVVRGIGVDNDPCQLGHGTFVGGITGARGNNGVGVVGVAWDVSLVDISTVSGTPDSEACNAGLADTAILRALDYAINNPGGPVDVVNMSFGRDADRCPTAYQNVIASARNAGVVLVAAAGNGEDADETRGRPMVPASCDGVISVGATRINDLRASYSTTNPFIDLMAPGGDGVDGVSGMLLSTSRSGTTGYGRETGTSHAAPYVAGAAALVRALRPDFTPDQVESVLELTALDLSRPGRDNGTGWGLVRIGAALAYIAAGNIVGPPEQDPPFPAESSTEPWVPPTVVRISGAGTVTQAESQAAAVSRSLFTAGDATHAVLARADDFADALAGSALGNGLGPLLFTPRTGPLAPSTRDELLRAVAAGATVYLLGGTAALPSTLEAELRELGFVPIRLSGSSREQTAAAIATEVDRLGLRRMRPVLLARSDQWPDAVAGGSLAAWFGLPILLTSPTSLHPATRAALVTLRPNRIYALGGEVALASHVLREAGTAAGVPISEQRRLSGPGRVETAIAIAQEMEQLITEFGDDPPQSVLAINVRRADGFAHALSASMLSGATAAVMVPVDSTNGSTLSDPVRAYVRGFGINGILMGGNDVISDAVGTELQTLLRG